MADDLAGIIYLSLPVLGPLLPALPSACLMLRLPTLGAGVAEHGALPGMGPRRRLSRSSSPRSSGVRLQHVPVTAARTKVTYDGKLPRHGMTVPPETSL